METSTKHQAFLWCAAVGISHCYITYVRALLDTLATWYMFCFSSCTLSLYVSQLRIIHWYRIRHNTCPLCLFLVGRFWSYGTYRYDTYVMTIPSERSAISGTFVWVQTNQPPAETACYGWNNIAYSNQRAQQWYVHKHGLTRTLRAWHTLIAKQQTYLPARSGVVSNLTPRVSGLYVRLRLVIIPPFPLPSQSRFGLPLVCLFFCFDAFSLFALKLLATLFACFLLG